MPVLNVDLGDRGYPIVIDSGILNQLQSFQPYLGKGRVVIVTNDTVAALYLDAVESALSPAVDVGSIILPDGEQHKHLASVNYIYDYLLENEYDRQTVFVALGGGVIGDITGFAAATYQRGIDFIQVPTTLLAQVDSSVGGKTGVNHTLGKNMIGAFYQPRSVIIDIDVLRTLPVRELKAGLAEVIKYGLIGDREFFDWLGDHSEEILALDTECIAETVKRCCEAKAAIVAEDEKESGVRALLNLGHTFGHAIETASGYGTLLHGETVAMGMVMAADLSRRLGMLDADQAGAVRQMLESKFAMPVIPPQIPQSQFLDLMASDKKAESGRIRFILLNAIGKAVITADVGPDALSETLCAGEGLCQD